MSSSLVPGFLLEHWGWVVFWLFMAIVAMVSLVKTVNHWAARHLLGARIDGLSFSGRLWQLEQDKSERLHWVGELLRPQVDYLFFRQPNHCRVHFERESGRKQ